MSVILETKQLCKFYGAGENQVKAVNQVDIQIPATFIKQVFADALVDVEISTIIRKLRMEGTCIIELLPSLDVQGGIKTNYCC